MPNPTNTVSTTAPTPLQKPVEIPWEEAQALLAASSAPAKGNHGPTEIKRPVQIPMEEALALIAKHPPPRAPLFVQSPMVTASIDPLDRWK